MKRNSFIWLMRVLVSFIVLSVASCGTDNPLLPSNIESGNDVIETTGSMSSYYMSTDLGQLKAFSLYMNNNSPVITTESGFVLDDGNVAPDPTNWTKELYPLFQESDPAIGNQYYFYIEKNSNRYFARILITGKETLPSSNYSKLTFSWDFNNEANNRNF